MNEHYPQVDCTCVECEFVRATDAAKNAIAYVEQCRNAAVVERLEMQIARRIQAICLNEPAISLSAEPIRTQIDIAVLDALTAIKKDATDCGEGIPF